MKSIDHLRKAQFIESLIIPQNTKLAPKSPNPLNKALFKESFKSLFYSMSIYH